MSLLRLVIGVLVTFVWAVAWTAAIIQHDYEGVGAVTPVFLIVVGALFGEPVVNQIRGKDRNGVS